MLLGREVGETRAREKTRDEGRQGVATALAMLHMPSMYSSILLR